MTTIKKAVSVLCAGALVLMACGSDDDEDDGATSGGTASGSGEDLVLDEPVKVVLLAEVAGESAYGVDDYNNGALLAVEQINAAGGIGGQDVELVRFAASPVDPQDTLAAFLKALDEEPTAVLGLPAATSQLNAIVTNVERSGVPVIVSGVGDDSARFGNEGGSTYAWFAEPNTNRLAEVGTQYLIDELGAEKIGLLATNESHGAAGIDGAKVALEAAGLEPLAERTYDVAATDLTEQVIAMQGADAVGDFGYPGPVAVQLAEFVRNGTDIPTMASGVGQIIAGGGMAEGEALANLYDSVSCNPSASDEPAMVAFVDAYQEKFDSGPSNKAAVVYDSLFVVKAAVEHAGSADPEDVNTALGEITVTDDVVCSPEYRADGSHFLSHAVSVVDFAADGTSEIVKSYDAEDLPAAG